MIKGAQELAKPTVEALKKIAEKAGKKWEWEPEAGEHFIGKEGIPIVIAGIIDVPLALGTQNRRLQYLSMGKVKEVFVKDVTPLLHWERILRVLTDLGYGVFVETQLHNCRATISRNGMVIVRKIGEDSQSAMMQAVIELGKRSEK